MSTAQFSFGLADEQGESMIDRGTAFARVEVIDAAELTVCGRRLLPGPDVDAAARA
jgi:hypothetical protein